MLKIDEILMVIRPQPFTKILEIGCGLGVVTNTLAEYITPENGEIDLFELSKDETRMGILLQPQKNYTTGMKIFVR